VKKTIIHDRVELAREGRYPKTIARLPSGWAVLGDHQALRGYSLLLPDPVVPNLNALEIEARTLFLRDMSLLGDAALVSHPSALRCNYEILGNVDPALHAHVFPRYPTEPDDLRTKPVWFYDFSKAPQFDIDRDRATMQSIGRELLKLCGELGIDCQLCC
jgi:diadenosine tetraphosphate (Ap4A) HIT family hydrolase